MIGQARSEVWSTIFSRVILNEDRETSGTAAQHDSRRVESLAWASVELMSMNLVFDKVIVSYMLSNDTSIVHGSLSFDRNLSLATPFSHDRAFLAQTSLPCTVVCFYPFVPSSTVKAAHACSILIVLSSSSCAIVPLSHLPFPSCLPSSIAPSHTSCSISMRACLPH